MTDRLRPAVNAGSGHETVNGGGKVIGRPEFIDIQKQEPIHALLARLLELLGIGDRLQLGADARIAKVDPVDKLEGDLRVRLAYSFQHGGRGVRSAVDIDVNEIEPKVQMVKDPLGQIRPLVFSNGTNFE